MLKYLFNLRFLTQIKNKLKLSKNILERLKLNITKIPKMKFLTSIKFLLHRILAYKEMKKYRKTKQFSKLCICLNVSLNSVNLYKKIKVGSIRNKV